MTAATAEDVTEFFKRYYTPNNLSLVIAGDFEPADAKRLIDKYLGTIPPGPPLDRPKRYIPTLDREKVIDAMDRVPQERVYLGWPTPPLYAQDDAALDVAATILSDGLSSRLQKALVYDKPLASDVAAFQISLEISGVFVVQATARPGASLDDIQRVIAAEISRLAKARADGSGIEPGQDETRIQLHHRPGTHRRLRRQGGSAQPIQHVSWGPRQVRVGHPALSRVGRGGGQISRRALARHGQARRAPVPSRNIGSGPGSRHRSDQETGCGRRPALQDAGRPDGEAR